VKTEYHLTRKYWNSRYMLLSPQDYRQDIRRAIVFEGARLYSLLKNSILSGFASGHDFSRADKSSIFDPPRGL
jgi:hypothetical protein